MEQIPDLKTTWQSGGVMEETGTNLPNDQPRLEVNVLGPLEFVRDGSRVTLGGPKPQMLVSVLVANANRFVSTERLIDELWREDPPATAARTIGSYVSRLRRVLGDDTIASAAAGYQLFLEADDVDAVRFEGLIIEGRAALIADPPLAGRTLRQALSLWRGTAYAGLTEAPSLQQEAVRLDELRLSATEDRIEADIEVGRAVDTVGELEGLVREHPYRERSWGLLMLALYQADRQAEALAAYQRVRQVLGDQLGIEPSPDLQKLEEEILLQSPSLRFHPAAPDSTGLPAGLVTFLVTDVEESTRHWEEFPEAMNVAMATHDDLLGDLIARNGGHLFKNTGDGMCAVFSRADTAVMAAVEAQLALLAEPWDPRTPIEVRMALVSGDSEPVGGDYHGPVINRCARLMTSGHGGQVLMDEATRDLIVDSLPPQTTLRDLGRHLLRDMPAAVHIYQVAHPDFPAGLNSLRSLESFQHNLPVQLTSFVGRTDELAAISELLGRHRLVTLVGPGGCGKTRLAVKAGSAKVDAYADGVWFVSFEHLTDGRLVPQAVARATGVVEQPGRSMTDLLVEALRDRRVLLVLDNSEHLLDACAELVHTLLTRCEDVSVLVTSRAPLGVAGERVWRTPPLKIPDRVDVDETDPLSWDAVRLFAERATAANPSFDLQQHAVGVVDLCVKLDGLALAIELAAARLRTMSFDDIAARLDDRLRLLAADLPTTDPRHRTIRAAIDWSYDLLTETERGAFERLSVFAKGFDLPAAEAVLGGGTVVDALDLVARLTDKSLLALHNLNGITRYGMLETIRSYAREKLDAGPYADEAPRRHAEYFQELGEEGAEHLRAADQLEWLSRMEAEHPNLRAALVWGLDHQPGEFAVRLATALCWFWAVRGRWNEGRHRLEQALLGSDVAPQLAAKAQLGLGELAADSGTTDTEAVAALRAALATFEEEDLTAEQGRCFLAWGKIASHRGHLDEAGDLHHRALELIRQSNENWWIAAALLSLGELTFFSAGPGTASMWLEESLTRFRQAGDRWGMSGALKYLGEMKRFLGRASAGLGLISQSLDFARELEDQGSLIGSVASSLVFKARALDQLGAHAEASGALEEATELYRRAGNQLGLGWARANLVAARLNLGDLTGLGDVLEENLDLMNAIEHGQGSGYAHFNLARYLRMTGDGDGAAQHASSALETWRGQGDIRATVEVLVLLAHLALDRGDPTGARSLATDALGITTDLGLPALVPGCLEVLAGADLAAGSTERTAQLLGAAVALRSEYESMRPVCDQPEFELAVGAARQAMKSGEFEASWNEGVALGLETATRLGTV